MSCPVCDVIDHDEFIVYQDKLAVAYLVKEPANHGHIRVVPREHIPILEQISDELLTHLFWISNQVSIAVFELFGAQGTNIVVNNGVPAGQELPHFSINVVPRKQEDGVNFRWVPRQIAESDMGTIATKIKDKCDYIGHEAPKKEPVDLDKAKEISTDKETEEVDYRIKQLERIP